MMKMYETNSMTFGDKIKIVEVERITDASVWIDGRRSARFSEWHSYFKTFSEAKQYLVGVAGSKLDNARRNLESAQGYLGNVKGLEEK